MALLQPCEHITPRVDGALVGPCDDCYEGAEAGLSVVFTHGKDNFHGATIKERQEELHRANEAQGRKLGRDYEPVWKR